MKILNAMPPYNLFGLEEQDYDTARVVVLPVPYDSTSTYKVGSREGPRAIIEASRMMELYSEELDEVISDKVGVYTLEELYPDFNSPEGTVNRIAKEASLILEDKKVPLLLGGEHTIAVGGIRALSKARKDFSVLHFDAHADSRDEFFSSKYCHACIMARAREMCDSCYSVGVRSIDKDSAHRYGKEILYMKDMASMSTKEIVSAIIKNTKQNLYLTVDLDVLDSSEMPNTGTPEPGGLHYDQFREILRGVLRKKELLALDFNELNPALGGVAPNFLAAKLIYMALGYAFLK